MIDWLLYRRVMRGAFFTYPIPRRWYAAWLRLRRQGLHTLTDGRVLRLDHFPEVEDPAGIVGAVR